MMQSFAQSYNQSLGLVLTKVFPTFSVFWSYFHLTAAAPAAPPPTSAVLTGTARGVTATLPPTMELSMGPERGDPGTATVIVVSWSGCSPSPGSLMASVAISD